MTLKSAFPVFFGLFAALPASAAMKLKKTETNKKIVYDFYNLALNQQKPAEAVKKYVGNKYIQHNPYVPDGTAAFINYFEDFFKKNPKARADIKKVIGDGDLIALHVHFKKNENDRGSAIVDIFRVEDGKVVEHWDVIQEIPESTANANAMV